MLALSASRFDLINYFLVYADISLLTDREFNDLIKGALAKDGLEFAENLIMKRYPIKGLNVTLILNQRKAAILNFIKENEFDLAQEFLSFDEND